MQVRRGRNTSAGGRARSLARHVLRCQMASRASKTTNSRIEPSPPQAADSWTNCPVPKIPDRHSCREQPNVLPALSARNPSRPRLRRNGQAVLSPVSTLPHTRNESPRLSSLSTRDDPLLADEDATGCRLSRRPLDCRSSDGHHPPRLMRFRTSSCEGSLFSRFL